MNELLADTYSLWVTSTSSVVKRSTRRPPMPVPFVDQFIVEPIVCVRVERPSGQESYGKNQNEHWQGGESLIE